MKKAIGVILEKMAKEKGISVQQLRADMIAAIHAAATSENQETRKKFEERFHGVEPSPEEFITAIASDLSLPDADAPFAS